MYRSVAIESMNCVRCIFRALQLSWLTLTALCCHSKSVSGWPLTWRTWKTEKSENLTVVRESVFLHTVNYREYWSWHRMYKKGKSERRKDAYSATCKLCLKTFSLSNMSKQAVVSHANSSGHIRNVAEKLGNFIMTGEWPPCRLSVCHTLVSWLNIWS